MKKLYTHLKSLISFSIIALVITGQAEAQSCTPQGDQTTYGTNNVWKAYVYQGKNFDTYKGYNTEGISTSPNFDESFGGANTTYNTNGCPITTENFSVRYKLNKSFTSGSYQFTVGGDDGYRLSLDGGSTWVINNFVDHSYTTSTYTVTLNGSVNMVLEYYENSGDNRVSFNVALLCSGTGDPTVYGTNNVWAGYLYQGMNFDTYKGSVTEGTSSSPGFDENFGNTGNSNTATYNTNSCYITTYQFSARYRLTQTLASAKYTFNLGGDDGFRFSLDGGNTWVINKWADQSYATASYTASLSGTVNMVIEYYDNGGADRISFSMSSVNPLPVTITSWAVTAASNTQALLKWQAANAVNFDHFIVQRSTDGSSFENIHTIASTASSVNSGTQDYSYTDAPAFNGAVYYRLAMVDLDGTTQYSTIQSVDLTSTQQYKIYPTVVETGNLFVETNTTIPAATLEVYDMSGNKLDQFNWTSLQGRRQLSLHGSHSSTLPAGAYIARLTDGHQILAKQIILIK